MNPQDELGPVINTLSYLAHDWLYGFVQAIKTYRATIGLPPPHPAYPLPAVFPFGELTEVFNWVQLVDDATQINQRFPVRMAFTEGNAARWDPLVWTVHSRDIVIGTLELDRRISGDGDQFVISVDPIFILEWMGKAVRRQTKLVVSSRIIMRTPKGQVATPTNSVWYEVYEVRTAADELVKELERRDISHPRYCPECRVWLPHSGPSYCLHHLPT
ncbi:hypothetical protein VNI00_014011 [Paramarasmius palmivorus]|uniref:Uncharacterized protein n=1 Tax=Paramarasmius palmivorus TaxID=297713 RepID=A0AAW0BU25_9AGAR